MTGYKPVLPSPFIEDCFYQVLKIRMMRRPETLEQGLAYSGRYLIAQHNDCNHSQNRPHHIFPITFEFCPGFPIDNNKKETEIERNPRPFIRIEIEKRIPQGRIASV